MRFIYSEDLITIYIIRNNTIDLKDRKGLETYLKRLIVLLKKKKYSIKSGLYIARIYQNHDYGLIIELENIEELELFKDMIDLKILIYDNSLMYLEIDDYFLIDDKKKKYYNDNFYINIADLTSLERMHLSEFSKIIYGDEALNINAYGKLFV